MSEEVPPAQVVSGVGGIESEEAFGTPDLYETAREEWLIEGYSRALNPHDWPSMRLSGR